MRFMIIVDLFFALVNFYIFLKHKTILNLIVSIFVFIAALWLTFNYIKYPNPKYLKHSNGMIHHPTYGDYPEEVEYKQGMAIMPGQKARVEINLKEE